MYHVFALSWAASSSEHHRKAIAACSLVRPTDGLSWRLIKCQLNSLHKHSSLHYYTHVTGVSCAVASNSLLPHWFTQQHKTTQMHNSTKTLPELSANRSRALKPTQQHLHPISSRTSKSKSSSNQLSNSFIFSEPPRLDTASHLAASS